MTDQKIPDVSIPFLNGITTKISDLLYNDVKHRKNINSDENELNKVNLIYNYMNTFAKSEEDSRNIIDATISLMNYSYNKGYDDGKQNLEPKEISLPVSRNKTNFHSLPCPKTVREREKRTTEKRLQTWILFLTISILKILSSFHLVPKKLTLIIDGHGEPYYGKYSGKQTTFVKVGQSDRWQHGKQFHTISCLSPNLFLNFSYCYKLKNSMNESPFPKELIVLQDTILTLYNHGFHVARVIGDRGYFDTNFYSLSKKEMWGNIPIGFEPPLMLAPRQFSGAGNTKEGRKIEATQNDMIGKYSEYSMKVHYSHKKRLHNIWNSMETTDSGDGKLLKLYQGFYRNKMSKYPSLNDESFRQKLLKISDECIRLENKLIETKQELNTIRELHNLEPLKGEPRKWFHRYSDLDTCLKSYKFTKELLKKNVDKRQYFLNHLFCLVIAVPESLDINQDIPPIETLISLYSYRWRIENIFKAIKEDFTIMCSSKSCIRWLFRYLLGAMYWNYFILCNLLKWREYRIKKHKQYRFDRDDNFWIPVDIHDSRFKPVSRMTFKLFLLKQSLTELFF